MNFAIRDLLLILALVIAGAHGDTLAGSAIPEEARQIVVVTTPNWEAVPGAMQLFERGNAKAKWRAIGKAFPIVVGRSGLGWGSGLHPSPELPGPGKKEGDGKSPAGIFKLSSSFGLEQASKMQWVKLSYRHLTETIECVDDVKSSHYNVILDRANIPKPDWKSSEKMKSHTVEYRLGITVDHNTAPRVNGAGSCIFVHIWKGPAKPTSGCTAMADADMERVLRWLDPAKNPVMVQLPEGEYGKLRKTWALPKR